MSAVAPVYVLEYLEGASPVPVRVRSMDKMTDVGTGEVNTVQIMLNTEFGDFISESNSGTTPIFDQFDRFRLTLTDDNNVIYSRILIMDTRLPQQAERGQVMQIELFGRERFLQRIKFPGHHFFVGVAELFETIIEFYNETRGSRQPEILLDISAVPGGSYGTFDFRDNTSCYDALMELISHLNLSTAAGGAGNFFELLFEDVSLTQIRMIVVPQGGRNTITIEGKHGDTSQILETRAPIDASIVIARGQADSGTTPPEIATWSSLLEEYANFPEWQATSLYAAGVHVTYNGQVYRALDTVLAGGDEPDANTDWAPQSRGQYVAAAESLSFEYSPWTKSQVYRNMTTNPTGTLHTGYDSPAFADSNLVIRDVGYWRDWADFRVSGVDDVPAEYRYGGTGSGSEGLYEGMRLLLDRALGPPGAPFSSGANWGVDRFGNSYEDALVQLSERGEWIVIRTRTPGAGREAVEFQRFDQVVVLRATSGAPGGIYEYDHAITTPNPISRRASVTGSASFNWQIVSGSYLGFDCMHFPVDISDDTGLHLPTPRPGGGDFLDNSAVSIRYQYGETDSSISLFNILRNILVLRLGIFGGLADSAVDLLTSYTTYNYGWWATLFETPFPLSNHNSAGNVGSIFGGTEGNEVPVLDLNNLNYTPSGKRGYAADDAESLGPITAIHFLFNFDMTVSGSGRLPLVGNIPFRCTIYDTLSNVWTQDVIYRFLGEDQQMVIPISGFRIYRARRPIGATVTDFVQNTITPELSILDIFEQRKVKRITFQCQLSYDTFGRYNPANFDNFIRGVFAGFVGNTINLTGKIDALGFRHAPLKIAKNAAQAAEYNIQPKDIKNYPNVSNTEQLRKIAEAELSLAQHRLDTFNIKTTGFCDVHPGDSIILNEPDVVPAARNRLAVRKVSYSVDSNDGPGGFVRDISVYRRINA